DDGGSFDVTRKAKFQIADPELIRVDEKGVVTPSKSGRTKITVSFSGQTASLPVEVEQGEAFLPVDFQTEIVPILTRRGCNGGGCHGKTTGQGGFRLSLFGYNPSADYTWVTRDSTARRICVPDPENSLLLLKPTLTVGHAGGLRLKDDEPEYHRLVRWIESGAPEQATETIPTLERLQLSPAEVSLRPGAQQQLVAVAHYSDGTKRDVTRLVVFKANQNQIADVDEWGLVTAGNRVGEGVITATFSGQVAVSRVRIPLDRKWTEPDFPIQNIIDRHVLAQLRSLKIPPSDLCDEDTFLRRATLQIAGRLPTHEEVKTFQANPDPDKRQQLIQRLLDDPGYADHFAQKWSGILRNKRRGQTARIPGTIAFHRWIRRAIALNKPYDQFVREIITATGDVSVNPPAQWYAEVRYLDRYVDDTAQVFLGMRIGCARCHHHPFEKISQEDYF
ncbi:MAG: DUF1549 domain-containing protein, partial [Planctomycetaceae bacterium]|nr:DUF1549 domain-containing protein [Planctomycetaceae bacterium]